MRNSLFFISTFIALLLISCKHDISNMVKDIQDPWENAPLSAMYIEDGTGNWVKGELSLKKVLFKSKSLNDFSSVNVKFECNEGWYVVDNVSTLDLSSGWTEVLFSSSSESVIYKVEISQE